MAEQMTLPGVLEMLRILNDKIDAVTQSHQSDLSNHT